MVTKPKYITNKDLLREIHESKKSYCSFQDPAHADFDAIVHALDEITDDLIEAILLKKRTSRTKPVCSKRTPEELVFRVMTYDHIPVDPERKRRAKNGISYAKTTFEPFKHVMIKDGGFVEVCRSHWIGDFETGRFSADHGRISNALATMYMLLVERYSRRGNWRGYCVDETTQALTQRGWLRHDEITTDDMILSYQDGDMKWSKIKSIFRDDYDGLMFHLSVTGMDALVTPEHKFVTTHGLVMVDHLREKDRLVMLGGPVADEGAPEHDDAFVERVGRSVVETGSFEGSVPDMALLLSLSRRQRIGLLDHIMAEGLGRPGPTQALTDCVTALATLCGVRCAIDTEGGVRLLPGSREIPVESIDFHGGMTSEANAPTVPYTGKVWCPETEFGSFVARRNGTIFLTGNSYVDEMRSHALLQLSQIGLQFDESKSDNPFAFYTTSIKNCLSGETMIITREYGVIPIEQVAEQDVTLRDGNGDWVKCHIHDHGIRTTQKIRFQCNGHAVDIWSTPDHGWIPHEGDSAFPTLAFKGRNTEIRDGTYSKIVREEDEYRLGVVHGITYGDGSLMGVKNNGSRYQLRLCGEKAELMPYILETVPDVNVTYPPSCNGEAMCYFDGWCDLKALPENPGNSLDYLLGFLRGWFAADGCVGKSQQTPTLCGGLVEYEWLKTWGPLVGWYVNGCTVLSATTNFGIRKKDSRNFHLRKGFMEASDFLRSKHAENWSVRPDSRKAKEKGRKYDWTLVEALRAEGKSMQEIADRLGVERPALSSSYCQFKKNRERAKADRKVNIWMVYGSRQDDETREERVYCPVVNTTHSFVLGMGITTRNCFTRVLNLEKRNQKIRDDMLVVAGAMPSYTRQIENEMETRMLAHDGPDRSASAPKKAGRKAKTTS